MRRPPFRTVYLAAEFASSFFNLLVFTAASLYAIEVARLDPFQLVLVGTALEVSAFLFEVPTGVVADTISRRLSVLVGTGMMGLGFVLWGGTTLFVVILLAQVVWGVGSTFISGAWEAWAADESGEPDLGPLFLRGSQATSAGAIAGLAASVALASVAGLAAPLLAGGAGYLALTGWMAMVMPERHFAPAANGSRGAAAMVSSLRAGIATVRRAPILLTILAITFLTGAASEAFDRLWQLHLVADVGLPPAPSMPGIAWIGLLDAAALVLAFAGAGIARRRATTSSHVAAATTLLVMDGALALALVGFGLAGQFAAAASLCLLVRTLRRIAAPIKLAWINQSLTAHIRATVLSLNAQGDALGQILAGPVLGAFAGAAGTGLAMMAAGVLAAASLPLYWRTIRRHGDDVIDAKLAGTELADAEG
jgi:MFS transporter, DHA3 family, tetracycline resistance protein